MLISRTFDVYLHGIVIDKVFFIGEEYTPEEVRRFLIEYEKKSRDIKVKQIKEVQIP